MSVQSVCRLPSSYLPLPSQDITAGRPSGGQGQPSCVVERLTSAASACVCVWHQSRSKMGRDVQDSLRSGPRDPPSLGEGVRGPRLGDWQQQQQHRGTRQRRRPEKTRRAGTGRGESRLRKAGGGTKSCPLYETARWWNGRTRTRSGCPNTVIRDCANRRTVSWVR